MEHIKSKSTCLEQAYLVEPDAGLLCRILGLYASRGIDIKHATYAWAEADLMTLKISVSDEREDRAEAVRVLISKAASIVGVIAATMAPT